MRKLFFSVIIVFLLLACETSYYSVLIINNSSKTVSFTYNGSSDTIDRNTSKTYEVKAYTEPPQNINVLDGALSVKMNRKGDSFTFVDVEPFDLNVVNNLLIEVKIKADNYIDDNGSTEFTIGANVEKTTAKIYTSTPEFTSLIDYPVIIDWNVKENTMYVILR